MNTEFKVGDTVVTETYAMTTTEEGMQNITGTRFVTGTISSIERDVVKLDTPDGPLTTLIGQIEHVVRPQSKQQRPPVSDDELYDRYGYTGDDTDAFGNNFSDADPGL